MEKHGKGTESKCPVEPTGSLDVTIWYAICYRPGFVRRDEVTLISDAMIIDHNPDITVHILDDPGFYSAVTNNDPLIRGSSE